MRVVFRVEGAPEIGLGHVMRCMALAQSLVNYGHEVLFYMSELSQCFCRNQQHWAGDILPMAKSDVSAEPNWLVSQCELMNTDWLVLDGYQFDQAYRQSLTGHSFKLALFDDVNNSGELFADLVINGAPNAASCEYQSTAPKAVLALGQHYQVLRQEFLQVSRANCSERAGLTLTFGGSDPENFTIRLLQALQKLAVTMPITVITGAAYRALDELHGVITTSDLDIIHLHDCQDMAPVLVRTRLALSAAGGSQFELLACGTPSILVVVADNQKLASQDAAKDGWCQVVNKGELSIDELAAQALALWQKPELLRTMHLKALKRPVSDGAKNIVNLMFENTFRKNVLSDTAK